MELQREQLRQIEMLGEYQAAVRSMRWPAGAGMFFGLLTLARIGLALWLVLWKGTASIDWPILIVVVGISIAQVVICIRHLYSPSLGALNALAILMIVIGSWNVFLDASSGWQGGRFLVNIADLFAIGVGIHTLAKCRRLRGHFPTPPTRETLQFIEGLVQHVLGLKPKKHENVVGFYNRPFVGPPKRWRGLLLNDAAIFVTRRRNVLCGTYDEVSIERRRRLLLARIYKAVLRVRGKAYRGRISKQSLERFEAWKAAPAAEQVAGADTAGITDEGGSAHSDSVPSVLR